MRMMRSFALAIHHAIMRPEIPTGNDCVEKQKQRLGKATTSNSFLFLMMFFSSENYQGNSVHTRIDEEKNSSLRITLFKVFPGWSLDNYIFVNHDLHDLFNVISSSLLLKLGRQNHSLTRKLNTRVLYSEFCQSKGKVLQKRVMKS